MNLVRLNVLCVCDVVLLSSGSILVRISWYVEMFFGRSNVEIVGRKVHVDIGIYQDCTRSRRVLYAMASG